MSKFKVGDRCALYDSNGRELVTVLQDVILADGTIKVVDALGEESYAHPKQLRKLKKRRVIWINITLFTKEGTSEELAAELLTLIEPANKGIYRKFIEVKEK